MSIDKTHIKEEIKLLRRSNRLHQESIKYLLSIIRKNKVRIEYLKAILTESEGK